MDSYTHSGLEGAGAHALRSAAPRVLPASLAEILRQRVPLTSSEAVALVAETCRLVVFADPDASMFPEPGRLLVFADGGMRVEPGYGKLDLADTARLLQDMLRGANVPAPLGLFVSQALSAGRFSRVAEFAEALAQYEQPGRTELIQVAFHRFRMRVLGEPTEAPALADTPPAVPTPAAVPAATAPSVETSEPRPEPVLAPPPAAPPAMPAEATRRLAPVPALAPRHESIPIPALARASALVGRIDRTAALAKARTLAGPLFVVVLGGGVALALWVLLGGGRTPPPQPTPQDAIETASSSVSVPSTDQATPLPAPVAPQESSEPIAVRATTGRPEPFTPARANPPARRTPASASNVSAPSSAQSPRSAAAGASTRDALPRAAARASGTAPSSAPRAAGRVVASPNVPAAAAPVAASAAVVTPPPAVVPREPVVSSSPQVAPPLQPAPAAPREAQRQQPGTPPVDAVADAVDLTVYTSASPDVRPPVPLDARALPASTPVTGNQASNQMELIIGIDGRVETVRMVSRPARMSDMMMLSGAKNWTFKPALKDGRPVRYRLPITWTVTQ